MVLAELAEGMVVLLELARCDIAAGAANGCATSTAAPVDDLTVRESPVVLHLTLTRPLLPGERATIEALALALGTALERVRLDAEAREQRVRADLVRSRAAFLGAVTHDLRTPLATLKAATTTLCLPDGLLAADERAEVARAARSEVERLIRSVDKALELARIRSGVLALDRVDVTPLDLVRLGLDRLGGDVDSTRVRVEVDPDAPVVSVDALLMEHVLVNLLENALTYAPGHTEVLVRARPSPTGLVLEIVDHGPGVAVDDRDRVFEEFVRVGQSTGSGTGLGLAVARGLVEAHGGTVGCEETDGGGATFVVALPGVAGAADDRIQEVSR
jgi:two-component system sensor histidine kinase KdpD